MEKINWKIKDTLILFVIPLELALGAFLSTTSLTSNLMVAALLPFTLKLLSLIITIVLFHQLLREDWSAFKKKFWIKLILCALAAGSMYFVLSGMRHLVGISQSAEVMKEVTGGLPYGIFLIAVATPILAPLTEEIIFRHVLFYKFKDNLILQILMCLVSAFLFGAIHINNFGGNLFLTIPYMAVAFVYNAIYYFTKNIWITITIHFLFNFAQSIVPALLIPFLI